MGESHGALVVAVVRLRIFALGACGVTRKKMDEQTTGRVVGLMIGLVFIVVGSLTAKYPFRFLQWSGNIRRGNKHSQIPPNDDKTSFLGIGSYKTSYYPEFSPNNILATRVVGWALSIVGLIAIGFVSALLIF